MCSAAVARPPTFQTEAEALARTGAEIVAFNERRMGGIVWVEARAGPDEATLAIDLAARFAGSLAAT